MKIHSDILTREVIAGATPKDVYADVIQVGSRKRDNGFTVHLEYVGGNTGKGSGRRRSQHGDGYAATYDEHGRWMAQLYAIDPHAIIATYDSRFDFYHKTHNMAQQGYPKGSKAPWLDGLID